MSVPGEHRALGPERASRAVLRRWAAVEVPGLDRRPHRGNAVPHHLHPLLVGNDKQHNVAVFRVDRKDGALAFTGHYAAVGNPSMIVFVG